MNLTDTPLAAVPAQAASRRTVDAPTRVFHGLLALSFLGAYLTADGERWRLVHVTLGYTMAGLLTFRVLWGLLGPRHARLSHLARKLQGLPGWLQGLKAGAPNARLGQNLAMTLAITAVLALILPLTLSGYGVYQEWTGEWLEDVHEFFGNAMLLLVLAHVALVVGLSLWRRHNLVAPMLTGRVAGPGPDLARASHGLVAVLLLAAVLAFWGWQWRSAPSADLQAGGSISQRHDGGQSRHDDHDD